MGKSDRAVVFGALAFALGFRVPMGAWTSGLLVLTIALLVVTIVNRARGALSRGMRNVDAKHQDLKMGFHERAMSLLEH
jgi:CDP-diacylglycerol--glycerol-3-phosphate 3-phosphatidyltransferase